MYRDAADERPILVVAGDGFITGLERATGKLVWQHEIRTRNLLFGGESRSFDPIDLAIHGGRVYGLIRERVLCVDYLTGAPLGQVDLASSTARPTLLVDGDQLFVGLRNMIECYSLDGRLLWRAERDGLSQEGPAIGLPGNVRQTDDRGSR